jgi:hypothetical protein
MFARIICVILLITSAASAKATTTRPTDTFAGQWETTFGPMRLTQDGNTIKGAYGSEEEQNSIKGILEGKKFSFCYTESTAAGVGWFTLSNNGQSFRGKWRENGNEAWADWTGKRIDAPESFTGLWKTSYGRMRLRQDGNTVRGTYNFGGNATIEGTIDGRTLKSKYEQPDGEKGEGTFQLSDDAKNFSGTWQTAAAAKGGAAPPGKWTGSRIVPQPGKTWLVVLEANWEHDLTQDEYSFGVMLRTFFARVPNVAVRHRFFASEADFRRWTAELPYIAEPIVLHISSHGSREGIICGEKTIDGKTIAECLKGIGDLRLLHFGTCLVAGGDIPKQIHNALGDSAHFPISGYANSADWGGSAVIDFTYLDLIFSKHLSPAEAARQTRKMLSFATAKGNPGDAITPADLVIIEPKTAMAAGVN